ncbi:cholesterol dehydrogenase [Fusarium subglutinans]|uniref:Cholesterol dehydrogenase n=1 Tax=Gibberella subglutinans TaxID=42677 RepID=A0A8H5PEQ6_GIBSU|nr:cholesterol dehydrogenase [Fusarium subglutinans]KAF5595147.1 cholesterol dehydrogenase [Fusarium subglutinans]
MASTLFLVLLELGVFFVALILYLRRINRLLKETPQHIGQLRGKPWTPELLSQTCIRIIDVRETERDDLREGLAAQVDFVQTDITSKAAVGEAFSKPWDPKIAPLPLTVFHTAAVIIPGARSKYLYKFTEAVPFLKGMLPEVEGDLRTVQPGLITICTHLVASDAEARKPISEGGLGYKGLLTTLEGVVSVIHCIKITLL